MNKSVKELLVWILKYLLIIIITIVLVLGGNLLFIEIHKAISQKKSFILYIQRVCQLLWSLLLRL